MRRILLLITDLEIGGTPTVVRELARHLNHPPQVQVEVACLGRWGPVADQLRQINIPVTALDAKTARNFPRTLYRLIQLIRRRGYDTLFSFLIHANTLAALASLFCPDVRFIQSIQTTQPHPRWHWALQRWIVPAADRIVVPSPSVARVAADWSEIDPQKITIIPNAIDPDSFIRPRPSITQSAPAVGFIGRLDPIKRIDDLLEAAALLPDQIHLHIYGQGPQRPKIESTLRRLHLTNRVTLYGAIPHPHEALNKIDLLVLPSQAEGFGLVLIEAMAAGVPIVATDAPGIRDVVRHNDNGLLVPIGDPPRLAAAIARMIDDPLLRRRLAEAGHQTVHQQFDWRIVLPQYRRLLNLPPA